MAMPRPKGEALKIAERTIPGLRHSLKGSKSPKTRGSKNGDVEQKVMKDNNESFRDFRRIINEKKTRLQRQTGRKSRNAS